MQIFRNLSTRLSAMRLSSSCHALLHISECDTTWDLCHSSSRTHHRFCHLSHDNAFRFPSNRYKHSFDFTHILRFIGSTACLSDSMARYARFRSVECVRLQSLQTVRFCPVYVYTKLFPQSLHTVIACIARHLQSAQGCRRCCR